jgi:hypothetical protein
MDASLVIEFPVAMSRARNVFIWRWGRYERAMTAALVHRFGKQIAGVIAGPGTAAAGVPERHRDVPVLTLAEVRATCGEDFLILFNLQCFFEVFARSRDRVDPIQADRFGLTRIYQGADGSSLGVPEVMARIWQVFTERSISLARDMLDAFCDWYASGRGPWQTQMAQLAQFGTSYLPQGHYACIYLANGEFDRGWAMYEAAVTAIIRSKCPPLPHPFWNGEDFAGRKVIFRRERGPADEICYAGVFDELIDMGCAVVIECDPRLVGLFQRSFPRAETIPRLDPPHPRALAADIDFQATYSAPNRFLRDTIEKFPHHSGYLRPKPDRAAHWRERTQAIAKGKLRVGIVWRGLRASSSDPYVTRIEEWDRIFRVNGVEFFRLQYDECGDELSLVKNRFGRTVHDLAGIDLFNDLDELAALIAGLDLVISIEGLNAQMAGAVNTPAFLISYRHAPMFFGQNYLPFQPAVRVFISECGQPLKVALDAAADALADLTKA